MVVEKLVGKVFKLNSDGSQNPQNLEKLQEQLAGELKCDLSYFKSKIDYIMFLGAEIYQIKKRERFLTTDEKKRLKLIEEDMELHLKDLAEKCGVMISKEKILSAFEEDPDLLEQYSKAGSEIKLGEIKEEEKK